MEHLLEGFCTLTPAALDALNFAQIHPEDHAEYVLRENWTLHLYSIPWPNTISIKPGNDPRLWLVSLPTGDTLGLVNTDGMPVYVDIFGGIDG